MGINSINSNSNEMNQNTGSLVNADQAEIINVVNSLPFGFHRSELRVMLIQKFGTNR